MHCSIETFHILLNMPHIVDCNLDILGILFHFTFSASVMCKKINNNL